jgi:hypothetical protein
LDQLQPAVWRLMRDRLRCLNRLRKAQWKPLQTNKNFVYIANCLPWRLPIEGASTSVL